MHRTFVWSRKYNEDISDSKTQFVSTLLLSSLFWLPVILFWHIDIVPYSLSASYSTWTPLDAYAFIYINLGQQLKNCSRIMIPLESLHPSHSHNLIIILLQFYLAILPFRNGVMNKHWALLFAFYNPIFMVSCAARGVDFWEKVYHILFQDIWIDHSSKHNYADLISVCMCVIVYQITASSFLKADRLSRLIRSEMTPIDFYKHPSNKQFNPVLEVLS